MLTRRLQVLIEPIQYQLLERVATQRGESVGEIVRQSIDAFCDVGREARAEAVRQLLAMPPLDLPDDADELEAELDAMYDEQM